MKIIKLFICALCLAGICPPLVGESAVTKTNTTARATTNSTQVSSANAIVLPEPIPDPLERVNRGLWAVNEGAMKGVIKPSAKIYRLLVPPPLRIGISNVGKNLQYPKRVVNNLLQERWVGAKDESYRFLCNSVLGVGGLLDIASSFNIPLHEADFSQTFGKWGWEQNFYLMLPIAGPSSDRGAVGTIADSAVNPLTYFEPYNYIPTAIRYNDLTDAVDNYVRRSQSEMDPYSLLRYVSGLQHKQREIDWEVRGERDIPTLETLQSVMLTVRDPRFPKRGRTRSVAVSSTGPELPYSVWMQKKLAPIIFLIPGIGSHRLNQGAIALAEVLYEKGFSVVTISSAFNYEFVGRALSAHVPGYAPSDVRDIHRALTRIDQDLRKEYPGLIGQKGLMGYSMGGFHALLLAAYAAEDPSLVKFDRYLAIDAPVRLLYSIDQLDSYYNAALDWPADERTDRIEQLLLKVAGLSRGAAPPESGIPLSGTESRFLIGLAFRLNLRDVIFYTQMLHDQGVLQQPINKWKREPLYREIMNYSFGEYLEKFIAPYYLKRGIDLRDPETLKPAVDLKGYERTYGARPEIRVIANENDILLAAEDVQWLRKTFGERVTLFPRGGHLGNLSEAPVQAAILQAFDGMGQPLDRPEIMATSSKQAPAPARAKP